MNKIILVGKREYLKTIRTPTFWITTLFFPFFMLIASLISGYSASSSEEALKKQAEEAKTVLILDETGYVNSSFVQPPYKFINNFDEGLNSVKENKVDAFIYYPKDLAQSKNIQVYAKYNGLIGNSGFNDLAQNLLKQSILSDVNNADKITIFNTTLNTKITSYRDGEMVEFNFTQFIVPIGSIILYFLLVFFASSFMLMSVSEEKENRMIETVLSIMKPRELIWGKIVGLLGIVVTQVVILLLLSGTIFYFMKPSLPIELNLSDINVSVGQIILSIFYIVSGFLIMVNIMVGVGAAVPTYKEAQSMSSIFIMLSILPIYFGSIILIDPSGTIAKITSYFPFTAPLILLFRNSLGELSMTETIISIVMVIIYVILAFFLSFKLFEIGSLEYNKKISLKSLFN